MIILYTKNFTGKLAPQHQYVVQGGFETYDKATVDQILASLKVAEKAPAAYAPFEYQSEQRAEDGTLLLGQTVGMVEVAETLVSGDPVDPIASTDVQFDGSTWTVNVTREKPPAPPLPTHKVPTVLIVQRLKAAGKLTAAITALEVPENVEVKYEWYAATEVPADHAELRALITAVGADVDAILAPVE